MSLPIAAVILGGAGLAATIGFGSVAIIAICAATRIRERYEEANPPTISACPQAEAPSETAVVTLSAIPIPASSQIIFPLR